MFPREVVHCMQDDVWSLTMLHPPQTTEVSSGGFHCMQDDVWNLAMLHPPQITDVSSGGCSLHAG